MKMEQSVPKRRHINFRRRGITQKKAYNIQYTAKVWNQNLIFVCITNNFFVLNFKLIIIIIIIIIIIVLYNLYAGYLQLLLYLKQTMSLGYIFAAVLYLPFILRVMLFPI